MIIEGKEWKLIKEYDKYYLMEDKYGIKECFLKIDIDGVEKQRLKKEPTLRFK